MEKAVVDLYAKVTVGATGAPTLSRGKGISSIARNSAGVYTITLQDTYPTLLNVTCTTLLASGVPASGLCNIVTDSVASAGTIKVQFSNNSAATEVDSGAVLHFTITLSNSSAV